MAYCFANFRLDPVARLLERDGLALEVPKRVFDCLCYLVEQRMRAVGRDELIAHLWHRSNVSDNQLAQMVFALRRLLDDDGEQQRLIRTVAGFGYHFIATLEDETAAPMQPAPVSPSAPVPVEADPADAPQAVAPPQPPSSPPRVRHGGPRTLLAAALLLAVTGGTVLLWQASRPPPPATTEAPPEAPGWTWVLPARIDSGDEDWARIGVASLVAERLRHNGVVVVPMQNVLTRLPGPAPEDLGPLRRELAAGAVVVPAIAREGEAWRVELRSEGASGPRRASATDTDLLAAARRAADQLAAAPARDDDAFAESQAVIAQLIRSRDFEAAHRQLARLPETGVALPETELLRIELDMEQGRHAQAAERAASLRARLDSALQPALAGRLGLLEVALMRHRGDAQWGTTLDAALALLREHGTPRDLGAALMQQASRAAIGGDYASAGADFAQARRQFLAVADEVGAAAAGEALAKVAIMQGRPAEALAQMQDSLSVYARYGAAGRQFLALRGILAIQFGMLRWSDAELTLERMRGLLAQLSQPEERAEYLRARMLLTLATGQLREASALLDESERERAQGEPSAESLRSAELYRMQLDLAYGRHVELAARGAQCYARVDGGGGVDSVPRRDQRELASYLWFEGRRRLREEDPGSLPELTQVPAAMSTPTTTYGWLAQGHLLRERGEPGKAEAAYREALRLAREFHRSSRVVAASDALIQLLLEQARVADAARLLTELLVFDAGLPERDFDSALLLARVRRAEGDDAGWRKALADATRIAGERPIPAELQDLPPR